MKNRKNFQLIFDVEFKLLKLRSSIKLLISLFLLSNPKMLFGQAFLMPIYFEDAIGERDTVFVGYDREGSSTLLQPKFGEKDLLNFVRKPGLDVRISNYSEQLFTSAPPAYFQSKKKITNYVGSSDSVSYIEFDVKTKHWPVIVHWDSGLFMSDTLRNASFITNGDPVLASKNPNEFRVSMDVKNSVTVLPSTDSNLLSYKDGSDTFSVIYIGFAMASSVRINTNYNPQCAAKPGWNLIFSDDFDEAKVDANKWDVCDDCWRSNFSSHTSPPFLHKSFKAVADAVSIVKEGNISEIKLDNKILNLNDAGKYACGDIISNSLKNKLDCIRFLPESFLEIRAKLPFAQGQGSAGWLCAYANCDSGGLPEYNEIDLWETNGLTTNQFSTNYIIANMNGPASPCSTESVIFNGEKIRVKDEKGGEINLQDNWVTYGLAWGHDKIIVYVNGKVARELDLTKRIQSTHRSRMFNVTKYRRPDFPLPLILNSGTSLSDDMPIASDFPRALLVDYVCVYKKSGTVAVNFIKAPVTMPKYVGTTSNLTTVPIEARFYPDVVYEWNSGYFDFGSTDAFRTTLTPKPGTKPGQSYNITLTSKFPSGYIEMNQFPIFLTGTTGIETESQSDKEITSYRIIDLQGKQVMHQVYNKNLLLDISSLQAGLYLVNYFRKDGSRVRSEKIIKLNE